MKHEIPVIYTIGYGNSTINEFIEVLKGLEIEVLADVRSVPYSKYARQFNKETLSYTLDKEGIEYIYLGESLGGKPPEEEYQTAGKADYEKIRESERFRKGILTLTDLAKNWNAMIMCAEEDPSKCHRNLLITQSLLREKVKVLHVRKDGSIETTKIVPLTAFW